MRGPNWRGALAAFIVQRHPLGFSWEAGRDCCLLVADAIERMTGEDPAAKLRGYRTQFGAARALVRLGHRSVVEFLDATFERTKAPRVGDVILVKAEPPLDLVAIMDRSGTALVQGPDGLIRIPAHFGAPAWAVR